jgi:hypothetical protein
MLRTSVRHTTGDVADSRKALANAPQAVRATGGSDRLSVLFEQQI